MTDTSFATSVDYPDHAPWARRARVVGPEVPRGASPLAEARHFLRTLRALWREPVLVLKSASGRFQPDLLATACAGLFPLRRRPRVVLMGCFWKRDPGWRGRLEAFVLRLADRAIVRYAVQSEAELETFPASWGVRADKLRFVPYFATITEADLRASSPRSGHYVFAGGNAHRDYDPLVEAARRMPDVSFVLATSRLEGRADLPPNLEARSVSHNDFMGLLRGAEVVVVPLLMGLDRSAGQQTYLNAMWLGKVTIVNDALGARDYVRDGETGLVVSGDVDSYVRGLAWALDPVNASRVRSLAETAAADVRARFTFPHHADALLAVVDDVLHESPETP